MKEETAYSTEPVTADQIREGDPYELSGGHPIRCYPAGGRGSQATGVGYKVLESDPAVKEVGVDTGYSPSYDQLRAPDVAVGNVPDAPGWVKGVPLLAVEYADTGQDEAQLEKKIDELLAAGTRLIWVVRLTGPRRVEVHTTGQAMRVAHPGDELSAPGILDNRVPVEALYDPETGGEIAFRNQLQQRAGAATLDEVRARAEATALRRSIEEVLDARGLTLDKALRDALSANTDLSQLRRWLRAAVTVEAASELLG